MRCKHCNTEKPDEGFYVSNRSKCKDCVRSAVSRGRQKNPDLEALRSAIRYDPATGLFTWSAYRGRNAKAGSPAGTIRRDGRIGVTFGQVNYLAHRLAWFYVRGEWPENEIDHKDGDFSNNEFSNLRMATRTENAQNLKVAHANNKSSGLLGAYLHKKGRWMSGIGINGKFKYLGLFDSKEEAHATYLNAKRELHDGCLI